MSEDRFAACLPFTLREECNVYTGTAQDWSNPRNLDNDPDDPGGETMCGVTQREYSIWRKSQRLPPRDVMEITCDEGEALYRTSYWEPECPLLPPGVDLMFFDTSVNQGPFAAMVLLQLAIGTMPDGLWGPATAAALHAMAPTTIIANFALVRATRYRHTRGFWKFGADWIRRTREVKEESMKMALSGTIAEARGVGSPSSEVHNVAALAQAIAANVANVTNVALPPSSSPGGQS